MPAFDVAVPVLNVQAGSYAPLGVVVYSAPLPTEFSRFGPVIGYTPVFLGAHPASKVIRFTGEGEHRRARQRHRRASRSSSRRTAPARPAQIAAHAIYDVAGVGHGRRKLRPARGTGGHVRSRATSASRCRSRSSRRGRRRTRGRSREIAFTALIVVCILVLLFVDRFVRRPVARLERGVERIAAGDYTTDIPVTSRDELGRLAAGVNRMREQIAGYIEHIDESVGHLQEVSRALTTTTGGIEQLQDAVLGAADAIAGGSASAALYARNGARHSSRAQPRTGDDRTWSTTCRRTSSRRTSRAASSWASGPRSRCRCSSRKRSPAVLVVASDAPVAESDERALITLANNAAVAIENTRTLEQEREAVRRLSELNQLKSDFLDTAQHELRTPVLAIQGQIELLNVAWDKWDEATRLDIVRDVDISVRLLGETVENVVDFALVNSDTIDVRKASVDVPSAINDAANDVRRHFKDGASGGARRSTCAVRRRSTRIRSASGRCSAR